MSTGYETTTHEYVRQVKGFTNKILRFFVTLQIKISQRVLPYLQYDKNRQAVGKPETTRIFYLLKRDLTKFHLGFLNNRQNICKYPRQSQQIKEMELTNQTSEQMHVIGTKQGKKLKGLSQIG